MVWPKMTTPSQADNLQSAIEKFEQHEYPRAIELLEPLVKLGSVKAKSYLAEIYWHVEDYKDLKRAAQLQKELNEIYDSSSRAYEIGVFRETLMLLETSDYADNTRLNSLFMSLKDSRYDRNLLLAASIAKSDRIKTLKRERPLALYLKAFKYATSFSQKRRILGLILIEFFMPSKKSIIVVPRPGQ